MNLTIGAASANVPLALQDPASLTPDARAQRRASLGRSHRAVGVDPRYLQLPEGKRLWFVHVVLDLAVHAGCLGFTKHVYEYALGADAHEAEQAVRKYFAGIAPDSDVIHAEPRLSSAEHPEELAFPDQVRRLDMPAKPLMRTLSS